MPHGGMSQIPPGRFVQKRDSSDTLLHAGSSPPLQLLIIELTPKLSQSCTAHIPAGSRESLLGCSDGFLCAQAEYGTLLVLAPGHQIAQGYAGLALNPLLLLHSHDLQNSKQSGLEQLAGRAALSFCACIYSKTSFWTFFKVRFGFMHPGNSYFSSWTFRMYLFLSKG